jgi:hypothetical protein
VAGGRIFDDTISGNSSVAGSFVARLESSSFIVGKSAVELRNIFVLLLFYFFSLKLYFSC